MNTTATTAVLLATLSLGVSATPAFAGTGGDADRSATAAAGCVSDAAYAKLAVGQRLSYVRAVAGDAAQITARDWSYGANAFHERVYAMCTPVDSQHDTLTTRFMYFQGAWRALVVDTHLGPEE